MRTLFRALILVVFSLPSFAQSSQKIEIFGGFSYLNYEAASVNLPSGTETITFSCPSSGAGVCTSTQVGPSTLNFNPRMGLYGWNGSVTADLTSHFGLITDISGNYSTATRSATTTETIIQTQTCSPTLCTPGSSTTTETYQYVVSEPLIHHFLFGPQFSFPAGKMRAYGHFLIGGNQRNLPNSETALTAGVSLSGSPVGAVSSTSQKSFAMGFGGGADYPLRKKLAWRTGVDYLTSTGTSQNHVRVSTGLVWQIGK